MVKNKKLSDVDPNEKISVGELEDYLGYYEIKGTTLKLKDYQVPIFDAINKTFETKNLHQPFYQQVLVNHL